MMTPGRKTNRKKGLENTIRTDLIFPENNEKNIAVTGGFAPHNITIVYQHPLFLIWPLVPKTRLPMFP
jgi:hypothetical protein